MCGICGVAAVDGRPVDRDVVQRMAAQLVHRGPDDEGYYFADGVGLGFRRLAIIDVAGGHQPLSNEDGTVWVVFNGEIYNYAELRADLVQRGHRFKTGTDTEVLVHLYEECGERLVDRLRGMFAFAIWDGRRRQLLLARDPFGIKPLYYSPTPEGLVFASEIKGILEFPGVVRKVRIESLWSYLTFQYVPDPHTMFEGILKLPPAHRLLWREGQMRLERYWQAMFEPETRPLPAFVEEVREALRDSVKVHMNSDVPRGAFLSSGVDSSTIVALLKELEHQVKTFTVGFEGAGGLSEIQFARETARILGTEHRDVVVSAKTYSEVLSDLAYHQDEPVADPSAVALYFVAELASSEVTVVLSGEGADELFGGYTIYREPLSLQVFRYIPDELRKNLGQWAKSLPAGMKGRGFLLRGSKSLSERYVGNAFIFDEEEKRRFVTLRPEPPCDAREITGPVYDLAAHLDEVTQMQMIDLHTWLPGDILMKADKMTMANSLELRVPFLDRRVFEVARRIPTDLRLLEGTTKYVLREAVRGILPEAVVTRKKLGFPVPTRVWLRGELYEWARERLADGAAGEFFDREWLLSRLEDHREGRGDYARKLWTVLMFLLWYDVFIARNTPVGPKVRPQVLRRKAGDGRTDSAGVPPAAAAV
ncbi:MAG: asparagine synthase (glutamine-hydrolyzing) [Alicyclobacillaceae bacterium]|nr:asparagine synthase (glutamine-hydrolyzing) [Alicyclobacillaceae bacterium]